MIDGQENTHELMQDMGLFASTLQCVYQKYSKWPPSSWIHSTARFGAHTEMDGSLIILVAHVKACVDKNVL
jgi:hypothetical protein